MLSQDESLRQARLELEAARKRLAELIAAYDKDKRTALTWSQRQAKADAEAHVRTFSYLDPCFRLLLASGAQLQCTGVLMRASP